MRCFFQGPILVLLLHDSVVSSKKKKTKNPVISIPFFTKTSSNLRPLLYLSYVQVCQDHVVTSEMKLALPQKLLSQLRLLTLLTLSTLFTLLTPLKVIIVLMLLSLLNLALLKHWHIWLHNLQNG